MTAVKAEPKSTSLNGLVAHGVSVLTPLGDDVEALFYAVSSGISGYNSAEQTNSLGSPMVVSKIPDEALTPINTDALERVLTRRQERMLASASTALAQLAKKMAFKRAMPLVLAAPEKLPGWRTPVDDRFLPLLAEHSGVALDEANSYVLPRGRAAGFQALSLAHNLIAQGVSPYVLVGAVDCMVDEKSLAHLEAKNRVLGQGIKDGFAPGEAAVFYLVSQGGGNGPNAEAAPSLPFECVNLGESMEPGHIYNDTAYTGEALSDACRAAINGGNAQGFGAIVGTLNGESYYAKEWGVAQIRLQKHFTEQYQVEHPADCLGDLGAASGLVNLALVQTGLAKGQYRADVLLTASSELGERSALWVKR